jgi:acyl carrier protein
MQSVRDNVLSVVIETLKPSRTDPLSDENRFAEDLGADSLEAVELVLAFEKFFGIEIADEEAANTGTVGEAIALVSRKVARP